MGHHFLTGQPYLSLSMKPVQRSKKPRHWNLNLRLLDRYYRQSGGYTLMQKSLVQMILLSALAVVGFWALNEYVIDLKAAGNYITKHLHWSMVVLSWFLSEIVVGIMPPNLYIIWARSFEQPWIMVWFLAIVSYGAGIVSFFVGQWLHRIPLIKRWIDDTYPEQFGQVRRFGGLLIFLGAMTPLPFSPLATIAGAVGFKFRDYLIVSLSRFLNFGLNATLLFGVL